MRFKSLRLILPLLLLQIAGCYPGKDSIDERALDARLEYQSQYPSPIKTDFAPVPPRADMVPDRAPFVLGPEDVVRILVLNQTDLNTVQPVRPDGKIAFFPTGDVQAAGRTVEQLRDDIVKRLRLVSSRSYRLGVQDVVDIRVYGHEDLNTTQTVGPDGDISVLPGGSIRAAGRTVDELSQDVSKRVAGIVQNPIVNVSVKEYKS